MPAARPFIFVLAGVNGAGKSSVGGALLAEHGLTWFNPDSYARELVAVTGSDQTQANARAWNAGRERLEQAISQQTSFALETTLGGDTITALLARAAATHDVVMIYCGLASPQMHVERVRLRVQHGGHDIPEAKIQERWIASRANLIRLLPRLTRLQVFDEAEQETRPIRVLLIDMDPQGNATSGLGLEVPPDGDPTPTMFNVLHPEKHRATLRTVCTVKGEPVLEGEAYVSVPSRAQTAKAAE